MNVGTRAMNQERAWARELRMYHWTYAALAMATLAICVTIFAVKA